MLKQKVSRLKQILTILLAVLFVLSLTTVAASAHGGGRWGWGGYPYCGYDTGCVWVNDNWICPSYIGMPYTMQASAPATPTKDPDPSPNLAGVAIFSNTTSTNSGISPAT
jgi:hypothetical protein